MRKILIAIILLSVMLLSITVNANPYPQTSKPVMKYFVMSFCPYGNQVEDVFKELYSEMGKYVTFEPHYILGRGSEYNGLSCIDTKKGNFCTLHGASELYQDIREVCVKDIYGLSAYYKFVAAMNSNCLADYTITVESCWRDVTSAIGINAWKIDKCFGTRSAQILNTEFRATDKQQVFGSPTIFINNVQYFGDRTEQSFKTALCSAIKGKKPAVCLA